jgi:hypothetical protein
MSVRCFAEVLKKLREGDECRVAQRFFWFRFAPDSRSASPKLHIPALVVRFVLKAIERLRGLGAAGSARGCSEAD